ncbi:inhibitor of growth protein 1 [Culicoides brevitarsis]|uniref:inhibitor of growth protein 1 n=1 Tax=Culicoides brevitarsis TaxID=469753 RepID=UPI00307BA82B
MLNQIAVEALYSATYVENYLDAVENLPDEIQRYITRIREIDVKHRSYLRDVDIFYEQWANCSTNELESTNATKRNRAMTRIQQSLIAAQELGDEKLQIVQQLTDLIESKTRQLDQNFKNLDYGKDEPMNIDFATMKERRSQSPSSPVQGNASGSSQPYIAVSSVSQVSQSNNVVNSSVSTASSSSQAGSSNGNADRSNKRARRQARQDTGSGMDVDGSDSNTKPEPIITSSSSKAVSSSQSGSSSSQKKAVNSKNANNSSSSNNKKKRTSKTGTGNTGSASGRQSASGHNSSRDAREDTPPQEETIDPDEPTYCLCDQISFGEMILCDNDLCPIEWFHFSCVGLATKPKGRWYCPNCRGDRPNVMKPKAQFLKELERYNKEKEEKT